MAAVNVGQFNRPAPTSAPTTTGTPTAPLDWQIALAQNNVANSGSNLGALGTGDQAYDPSMLRWDQTNAERTAQQMSNYQYGGSTTGRQDAIDAMRSNLSPYTDALTGYAGDFYNQYGQGTQDYQTGIGSLYGTGDTLMDYANQGPGASVAQAQLDANTAMAMRQQLALAGSGRGPGGAASAYRNAAAQQAQIQGQANAQSAMLQAQEEQNWRQAQLQAYGQAGALYGQGAGLGSQYASNMGNFAMGAQTGAAGIQQGVESGVNAINTNALQGSMGYESNLTNIYGIDKGNAPQAQPGTNWLDVGLSTGGAVAGAYFGGPAGAAAGYQVGHTAGSNLG